MKATLEAFENFTWTDGMMISYNVAWQQWPQKTAPPNAVVQPSSEAGMLEQALREAADSAHKALPLSLHDSASTS